MATPREMRLRIRSVNNIAQVTRALEAVSASRIRRAEQQVRQTRPYADKAWQVLRHLARQPARGVLHPLLTERSEIRSILVMLVTSDRGLAGAYNTNIVRFSLQTFREAEAEIRYVVVGRKGRDTMIRRGAQIEAEFSQLPAEPSFADVSAIGRLLIDAFLEGKVDQVHLVYTDFVTLLTQRPTLKQLLPFEIEPEVAADGATPAVAQAHGPEPAYIYEPGASELIGRIVPRLAQLQVYEAILESMASEHAARMVAMRNATENAKELAGLLRLEYNKARQQAITSEMLDIVGGVEAQV